MFVLSTISLSNANVAMYDSFLDSGVSVVCGLKCNVVPLLNHLIEGYLQRVLLGGRHAHLLSAVQYSRPPVLLATSSSRSMNSSRLSRSTFLRLEPEFGVMSNPIIVDILVVQYSLILVGLINNQSSCFSPVTNKYRIVLQGLDGGPVPVALADAGVAQAGDHTDVLGECLDGGDGERADLQWGRQLVRIRIFQIHF